MYKYFMLISYLFEMPERIKKCNLYFKSESRISLKLHEGENRIFRFDLAAAQVLNPYHVLQSFAIHLFHSLQPYVINESSIYDRKLGATLFTLFSCALHVFLDKSVIPYRLLTSNLVKPSRQVRDEAGCHVRI